MHVNTRSIFKKLSLVENLYSCYDIIFCSETWLDDRIPDNLVKIDRMKVFRSDRKKGINDYNIHIIGGGVCIYVAKKWIDYTRHIHEYSLVNTNIEIVTIAIAKPNFRKILIACVYKPPKGKLEECIKV